MATEADELEAQDSDGDAEPGAALQRIGEVVASTYRITRYIGSGGSSHVYEAEHVRLGKAFAVKLLRREVDTSRKAAQRFRREARAVARIQNEHVVSVIDCGELGDQTPYLVMELMAGEDLRSLLGRSGQLAPRRAVHLILDACRGLKAVHTANLVHRDLKPENLFVTRRATGEDWCKVLDFGVAKMEASQSTAQGAIVGTIRYMAPEQLADTAAVGPATDVYALGAILYECLCGRPLHEGESVQEVMYRVMNREPEPLETRRAGLPEPLVSLIMRCVAKQVEDRPATMTELESLLTQALGRPAEIRSDGTVIEDDDVRLSVVSPQPRLRPPRALWLAPAVGVLAGGVFGYGFRGTTEEGAMRPHPVKVGPPSTPVVSVKAARSVEPSPSIHTSAPVFEVPSSAPSAVSAAPATGFKVARPKALPASVAPAASASSSPNRRVAGGTFDEANPYGE